MIGRDDGEPTLLEAWQLLAQQMGVVVEERGKRSVRATGTVRGRGFFIDIEGKERIGQLLRSFADRPGRRQDAFEWRTELAVSCANPAGLQGLLASFVDVNDPSWDPRNYDRANGRKVGTNPPPLASWIVSPSIHQQLMSLWMDVQISIEPGAVRLVDEGTSEKGHEFVVGSLVHQHPGPPVPWPDRALVGPPWWTLLLCEIAETVDAAAARPA